MHDKAKNYIHWLPDELIDLPLVLIAGYNEFNRGDFLDWHKHEGYELTFVVRGSVIWELESKMCQPVYSCQVSHIMPGVVHRGIDGITFPCQMLWLVFNPEADQAHLHTGFSKEELLELADVFRNIGNSVVKANPFLINLLTELRTTCCKFKQYQDQLLFLPSIRNLLCQIILQSAYSFMAHKGDNDSKDLAMAREYIYNNMDNQINIRDLADFIGKKETYIYNLFKRTTGQTPVDFWQRQRIQKAAQLLKNTKMPVTRIAFELGFSSSQYFSKIFNKYMGRSPSLFRREESVCEDT